MSVQTGLSREMDCLKDQLDVMREAWHNLSDSSGRYEWEETDSAHAQTGGRAKLPSLRSEACLLKLPSLRSEACLVTGAGVESSQSQSNLLEHSFTLSHSNLAKVMTMMIMMTMLIIMMMMMLMSTASLSHTATSPR